MRELDIGDLLRAKINYERANGDIALIKNTLYHIVTKSKQINSFLLYSVWGEDGRLYFFDETKLQKMFILIPTKITDFL